jgi:hypothetical protein
MWKLKRPTRTAIDTFTTCISNAKEPLKSRLSKMTQPVANASLAFETAAKQQILHTIPRPPLASTGPTKAELEDVYSQRLVRKEGPGRHIYDEIIAAPAHGRCPLCGQRQVSTLDHHLPKAHYPLLAVVPLNLVPACSDCNKAKHDKIPKTAADVSLHPYFDDVDSVRWLRADLVQTRPSALRFRIDVPSAWSPTLAQRARNHFRILGLQRLYAAEAAEELLNIRHQLAELQTTVGNTGVKAELQARALSCASVRPNSWRTATYEAWASNDWFCQGGFL